MSAQHLGVERLSSVSRRASNPHNSLRSVSTAYAPRSSAGSSVAFRAVFSPQLAVFINNHTTLQPSSVIPGGRNRDSPGRHRSRMRVFVLTSQFFMGYLLGCLSGGLPLARADLAVGVFTASLWRGGYELLNVVFTVLLIVIASMKLRSTHAMMQVAHVMAVPACACVLLVGSFEAFLACVMVLGASSGFQTASADAFITTIVDTDEQHARWTSFSMMATFCGVAIGTGTVGVWDSALSWKWAFAFAGLCLAVVVLIGLHRTQRSELAQHLHEQHKAETPIKGFQASLRSLNNPQFVLLTAHEFLERTITSSLEYFGVLLATETFHANQERAGAVVGACAFIAGVSGIAITTKLLHGMLKRHEGRMRGLRQSHLCFALYAAGAGSCIFGMSLVHSADAFYSLLFFAIMFMVGTWGAKITVKVTPFPPAEHPFVLGASQLIKMCAQIIGPLMFGAVAEQYSNRAALRLLAIVSIPQALLSLLSVLHLKRQSKISYTDPFAAESRAALSAGLAGAFDLWDLNKDGALDVKEVQNLVHQFLRQRVDSKEGLLDKRGRRCKPTDVWLTMWSFHFARDIVERYNLRKPGEAPAVRRDMFEQFVQDLQLNAPLVDEAHGLQL